MRSREPHVCEEKASLEFVIEKRHPLVSCVEKGPHRSSRAERGVGTKFLRELLRNNVHRVVDFER